MNRTAVSRKNLFLLCSAVTALSVLLFFPVYVGHDEPDANIYSSAENWVYFQEGGREKPADLFLLCPTVDMKDEHNMSLSDDKTKKNFAGALNMERGIYEAYTRMYAPYYRQAAMKVYELPESEREKFFAVAYEDVSAAFSYYLEHENNGRPIILAGFSQGADMCYRLMQEYFGDKALHERLVAVYAIGWAFTPDTAEKYPHMKPAQSERDTGVIISFECEAPGITATAFYPAGRKAFAVNPLNWRTDDTYADKSLNRGACFTDYSGKITREVSEFCGGYLDTERGIMKIPDIDAHEYPAVVSLLPEGAYHVYDYLFFFRNLQENVKTRIENYMNHVNI